jgi:uncharacterized protein
MICYLDTSALLKLYVCEEGTDLARQMVKEASIIATAKVAYPETRAALARGLREEVLTPTAYKESVMNFIADWPSYFVLELTDAVIYKAGELAELYKLRGFDSIHMASVLTLADVLAQEESKEQINIGCWDKGLAEALKASGFIVFP